MNPLPRIAPRGNAALGVLSAPDEPGWLAKPRPSSFSNANAAGTGTGGRACGKSQNESRQTRVPNCSNLQRRAQMLFRLLIPPQRTESGTLAFQALAKLHKENTLE
jgi:hypothetical protein